MAVKVVKDGSTIKFYPDPDPESSSIAHYLNDLVNQAKAIVGSADAGTVAKSGLAGIALIRQQQEDKLSLLKSIAEREDAKSRDTALSWELRELANRKSFAAREEARRIASELEGR